MRKTLLVSLLVIILATVEPAGSSTADMWRAIRGHSSKATRRVDKDGSRPPGFHRGPSPTMPAEKESDFSTLLTGIHSELLNGFPLENCNDNPRSM